MYERTIDSSWDFRNVDTKEFTHGYHPYPAMMIPQIARRLLNEYRPEGTFRTVFDPFMGSGTTLVEAQLMGLKVIGTDINPLARLISQVKTTIFNRNEIKDEFKKLKDSISKFHPNGFHPSELSHITNVDFWYSKEVLEKLDFISKSIIQLVSEKNKVFFDLSLAEIVRETSFTRNSEFKRYRMSEEMMKAFEPKPFEAFFNKIERNIKGLEAFLNNPNHGEVIIDSTNTVNHLPKNIEESSIDMVLTSPPYGDSRTTVAYGQFSRWANEWFKFENAANLDNILMGGRLNGKKSITTQSIEKELDEILKIDNKRYSEVIHFLNEYEKSIKNIAKSVRMGGVVCFVVGNRTVKGIQIPLDFFTAEKFEENGFKLNQIIVRNIPNKRMPSKNSPTNEKGKLVSTMTAEYIIILTKVF